VSNPGERQYVGVVVSSAQRLIGNTVYFASIGRRGELMTNLPKQPIVQAKDVEDEFLPPTPAQIEYLRKQKNQYAKLSVTLRDDSAMSSVAHVAEPPAAKTTASKEEFDAECRRILGFYIPAVEKGRLRSNYKDFIDRNRARTPSGRYKILEHLRKYDLSNLAGFEARFNREREELTEAKLKEIERAVSVDE
jgi:hypothetical protein